MSDRSVRSLLLLEHSASTARVLNLHRAWKKLDGVIPPDDTPFFRNPILDRCLIIKHRLRRNEADAFLDKRHAATKVMLPLDSYDLKLGARSFFIGQIQCDEALEEMFGAGFCDSVDYKLLGILDALPTLDPFLLRENLKRNGYQPSRRYFEVSDADLNRMFSFVQQEITPLVNMSFAGGAGASDTQTAKMVAKILQSNADDDMEPLRLTLRLAKHEYDEGVFCWKGFLYYKWCLNEIIGHVAGILDDIARIKPVGPLDGETREYLERSRLVLRKTILRACNVTRSTLQVYDDAYANLTQNGRPSAFREFLLDAPHLFSALGQRLGAVNHVVSFWRYRFPNGQSKQVSPEELMDIFMDFETGLNFQQQEAEAA